MIGLKENGITFTLVVTLKENESQQLNADTPTLYYPIMNVGTVQSRHRRFLANLEVARFLQTCKVLNECTFDVTNRPTSCHISA